MELTLNARPLSPIAGEAALVDAARHGDDRAFEQLYACYRERIHAFILSKVRDHGRAEDLAQEVFMSALRQLRAGDREIVFKPWLYTIAKNACIDEFRRGARAREVSYESDEELGAVAGERFLSAVPTPAAAIESKQSIEDLRGAFSGLSDSQHKLLVMREFEGLSYDEIGERLDMTKQMVESGLFRARRKLGEEYDELASGRRCQQIQTAIDAGTLQTVRGMGIKDKRRYSRHLSHCQLCRHQALMAGIDESLLKRSLAAKVAALLPFPLLRKLWPFGHGGGAAGAGGAAAGGAAAAGAGGAGQAAAIAALALAGAGGGLAIAEHVSHHHAGAPAPAVRHHVAPATTRVLPTTSQRGASLAPAAVSRSAAHHRAKPSAAPRSATGSDRHRTGAATAPLARVNVSPSTAPARTAAVGHGVGAPTANPIVKTRTQTRLPVAAPSQTTPASSSPTATSPGATPPATSTPTHTASKPSPATTGSSSTPPPATDPVSTAVGGVAAAAGSTVTTTGAATGGVVSTVGTTAGTAVTTVGGTAGTTVTKTGAAAGTVVTGVGGALGTTVSSAGAGTPLAPVTGAVGGALGGTTAAVGATATAATGAVGATVTGATAGVGATVSGTTSAVGTTLTGVTAGLGGGKS